MPRSAGTHAWTGIRLPYTNGNQQVHEEIRKEQVTRWTPEQIAQAERSGYFDRLRIRALANLRSGLLNDLEPMHEDME